MLTLKLWAGYGIFQLMILVLEQQQLFFFFWEKFHFFYFEGSSVNSELKLL